MAGCDVFISYKRGEGAAVEPIARKLKELGLEVWYDTRLETGPSFDEQIASKLRAAKAVLVCWTPDAIGSQWVRGEAAMAHEAGKLVACFLKTTKLIPPFNLLQTENLADWNGEDDHHGWTKVFARIASLSDDRELIAWATLMGQGDPKVLRAWASRQPPGPLRVTTRYWISELDGATVAIPDTTLVTAKRRRLWERWRRMRWYLKVLSITLTLSATSLLGLSIYSLNQRPTFDYFDVVFEWATSIREGDEVRFNGLRAGSIQSVRLDREDPNRVIARIELDPTTPVKTDSVALEIVDQATGNAFILLLPGSPEQPFLEPMNGEIPYIKSARNGQSERDEQQRSLSTLQFELYEKQIQYYGLAIDQLNKQAGTDPVASANPDPSPAP